MGLSLGVDSFNSFANTSSRVHPSTPLRRFQNLTLMRLVERQRGPDASFDRRVCKHSLLKLCTWF